MRFLFYSLFFFTFIFLSIKITSAQSIEEKILTPRERAVSLAKEGNLQGALNIFKGEYAANSTDPLFVADYIVVLTWAEDWNNALNIYEKNKNLDLPSYIYPEVARAYRFSNELNKALAVYKKYKQINPHDPESDVGLFHIAVELQDYKSALEYANSLESSFPNNPQYQILKSDLYLAQNRLHLAQENLENDLKKFRDNTQLKTLLAHVYLWRGWKRKALKLFEEIKDSPDDYVSANEGYAKALFENTKKKEAISHIDSMIQKFPQYINFRKTQNEFRIYQKPLLTARVYYAHELPGEDEFFISPRIDIPIRYNNTLFTEFVRREISRPTANDVSRKNYLGNIWEPNNYWRLMGAVHIDTDSPGRAGGIGEVAFYPDDKWSINIFHDTRIIDVPLRSKEEGTDVNQTIFSINYRSSELFNTTIGSDYRNYTDGNVSFSCFWYTDSVLYTSAKWKLNLGSEVYTTQNSRQDVTYFSPHSYTTAYAIPSLEHVWFRKGNKSFIERMSLGAGQVWQTDFGAENAGFINYEQDHNITETFGITFGTTYSLHSYDGDDVNKLSSYLTFRKRF